ncbi:MAG: aminotransferase class III-fold pyridoxal phosphate-dependent enzyme [Planctomycetota bacterium]|nr:aminotransferase class III-fold pyridoxal phosphate-dependent enzyme [Planctomycetota bacterium]MDA1163352.1 aminotransferase class III-fold pyridoxal phosphate-dependent enzyme [Planctomycetota bacterium]
MSGASESRIESLYAQRFPKSAELYLRAKTLFPSGVTHDARYLKPFPIYANDASGSRKTSVEGHEIIDYWMGHGALLLGHSHPAIVEAVQKQAVNSTHPGACHELELAWGEHVQQLVPSAERIRFTNSGTEATLMALRVARLVTGKSKVIKFAGHFHGWHDSLIPGSDPPHDSGYATPGVTDGVSADIVFVPPNDLAAAAAAIDRHDPACILHEGNGTHWGIVPARAEFLRGLRELTERKGIIFILDEVITGFRVHPNCFQGHCGIVPDMTTLAKVLAGGLPGGCLAGRADLMEALAFDNPYGQKMKHPGTYNANPLSAAAGVAALDLVATGDPSRRANEYAASLRRALNQVFAEKSSRLVAYGDFSAIKIHPEFEGAHSQVDDVIPFDGDWRKLDRKFDGRLSHAFRCALLLGGVDWFGWGGSTSVAHTDADLSKTAEAFANAIDLLREDGFNI